MSLCDARVAYNSNSECHDCTELLLADYGESRELLLDSELDEDFFSNSSAKFASSSRVVKSRRRI